MRSICRFLKSTILGGLVILVPLAVLGGVVAWAVPFLLSLILPVFAWLPDRSIGSVSLAVLAALISLVVGCFVVGLAAETAMIRRVGQGADYLALFVPGYALMKHVGADMVGIERKDPVKTVLVRFEASWQLGFLMETLTDGRRVVFVPGVPRALVGTLHIVEADRVQVLTVSVSSALDVLSRLGVGIGQAWSRETVSTHTTPDHRSTAM
jgi:uncharacterized membrane protein